MFSTRRFAGAVALSASLVAPAFAGDDANATVTLADVSVQGLRHPQEFDYEKGLRLMERFSKAPPDQRDKTRLAFYATGKKSQLDLTRLRLDVEVGEEYFPVEIKPTGEVVLPGVDAVKAESAKVVANVPKGSMSIIYKVDITPPAGAPLTLAYLRSAATQAREGWKRAYGGIAAVSVPTFTCANFEFTSPQTVSLSDGGRTIWTSSASAAVQVPLEVAGASDQAVAHWSQAQLKRIGGCKLKP